MCWCRYLGDFSSKAEGFPHDCRTHRLFNTRPKSSNSPAFYSCIVNADEAVMTNLQSLPWNRRSLLNHAGFMAQANPLCSDHRERHQRSGTNTVVWGAFALSCIVPGGWKRLKGEDSASLWLRNTPVAPVLAWCRHWTVAPGLPGPH